MKQLCFLFLLIVLVNAAAGQCEDGWTSFCDAKQCYCYSFISISMSWSRAHVTCKEQNANLVSIHSKEERDYVFHTAGLYGITTFWTGLNDQASEGINTWTDGTPYDFTDTFNEADISFDCYGMRPGGCTIWQGCPLGVAYPCWLEIPVVCKKPSVTRDICPGAHWYFCTATQCSCYFFSRYTGNSAARSWDEANIHCASMGGHLTSIKSEEEVRSLNALVKSTDNIWIGMHDKDGDGVFTWEDRSSTSFVNWATNQPTNTTGCVAFKTDTVTGQKAKWTVDDCSTPYHYICKREKNIV